MCRHDVSWSQHTRGQQKLLDSIKQISSGSACLITTTASSASPFRFYSSCGSSTPTSLTSNCPQPMTLGQTHRCSEGVTPGASTHRDTRTHTHTLQWVPGPLGEVLRTLPSLVTSHYSPLARCFHQLRPSVFSSVRGHPLVANKWANGVSGRRRGRGRRRHCCRSHRLAPSTVRDHPKAHRSQPPLHLCLADLANDVFIYSDGRT